jgi:hypothetical protein
VLINFFIFLTVLFCFSGLALDVGMVQVRKLQLQHAADAAALGALYEKARGNAGWVAAGKADAALNGFTDAANGVTITIQSPPVSGAYSGNSNAVQANVIQSYHTAFMGLVSGARNAIPGSRSVAMASSNPDCVYIMGTGHASSGGGNWGGAYLSLQNSAHLNSACNLYVNATDSSIANESGSPISVTGGQSVKVRGASGSASLNGPASPSPTFDSTIESDPLGYVAAPAFSSCTYNNKSLSSTTATLNPGTYCGGITIHGSTVTFNPGLYIVTGGMNWNSNSSIHGTGVTFYLTSGGGSGYGDFNISNSTVTLSAPTSTSSGGLTSIVVFGDRGWSNLADQHVTIGSSTVTTNGIWYVLNTGIGCDGGSTLSAANYLGIVTDNLQMDGCTFTVPSPDYSSLSGGSPYQGSSTGGIVE